MIDQDLPPINPSGYGWAGSLTTGPGFMRFAGRIGSAAAHTHAAVQVLRVAAGQVALRDATGAARLVVSAVIPAGVQHELSASPAARGAVAYLDPASRAGRAATQYVTDTGTDPARVDAWLADANTTDLGQTGPAGGLHPAVAEALRLAPDLVAGRMLLSDIAARVRLSASRLGHLFADQLGVPYPVWRRWLRLQHALVAVQAGANLTGAAHSAGFADSAHLTRSCRAMFGITPSQALHAAEATTAARPPGKSS